MKDCFFCLHGENVEYIELAKVFVKTFKFYNDSTNLHCVYDTAPKSIIEWLKTENVKVYQWTVPYLYEIQKKYSGKKNIDFVRGTYLTVEIAKVVRHYNVNIEFLLYVDIDTYWRKPIELNNITPALFASSTDWHIDNWETFSTGVMVLNVENYLKKYDDFITYIIKNNFNFEFVGLGPCVQGAWNSFFHEAHEKLPQVYDWKPWWGFNNDAKIVHFSGPKPKYAQKILIEENINKDDEDEYWKIYKFVVNQSPIGYQKFINEWQYHYDSINFLTI